MFKLISHLLTFAIGAGVGVYWGVRNPSQAQQISTEEKAKFDQAKQVVSKVTGPPIVPATP